MESIDELGKRLFNILAHELIREENPDSSKESLDVSEDKLNDSEKNLVSAEEKPKYPHSSDDISRSILMLSYAYRQVFRERFHRLLFLLRKKRNHMTYIRCFAEVSHENYSPLKFLIVCSFISEIYLFLFDKSEVTKKKRPYVKCTTKALKIVFQRIFQKDFPQSGWTDIQNLASKIAKGFQFLEPFMKNETSHIFALKVADAIMADNYEFEIKQQQIDDVMTETPLQKIVSANIPTLPNYQVLVPVAEDPNFSSGGLMMKTNEASSLVYSKNLKPTPVFPISFGTVDENPLLRHLVHHSGNQIDAVIFEDSFSGMEPDYQKVIETERHSNVELRAQENSTERISEDGPEPSFQSKLTENRAGEPHVGDKAISEQTFDEAKFWDDFLSSDSEGQSEPLCQTDKKAKNLERESCIADMGINIEEKFIVSQEQFGESCLNLDSEIVPIDHTIKGYSKSFKKNDNVNVTLSKENEVESKIFSLEANNPEMETFSNEDNDPKRETFLKKDNIHTSEIFSEDYNIDDPDNEIFLKDENVYDPESEIFSEEKNINVIGRETSSKEQNTSTSENAVNVPENLPEAFCNRQPNAALQDFRANEAVSNKTDAQQSNEISVNFQTNENDLPVKELHLDIGGRKIVIRVPANASLTFKYSAKASSTE